jgi:transcriptional regulator with XRE-family HTH domain
LVREAAGRSRRWVAGEIGRTYNAVVNYELGRSVPQDEIIPRYAEALRIDVEDLYERPGDAETLPEPARPALSERTDQGERLIPDPCVPVLVPGGDGKHIVCGRMRTPAGEHVLDTLGGSG